MRWGTGVTRITKGITVEAPHRPGKFRIPKWFLVDVGLPSRDRGTANRSNLICLIDRLSDPNTGSVALADRAQLRDCATSVCHTVFW
jgi:hypothetical protein